MNEGVRAAKLREAIAAERAAYRALEDAGSSCVHRAELKGVLDAAGVTTENARLELDAAPRHIHQGDVVQLVGDSRLMNVRAVAAVQVWCTWYDEKGFRHSDVFQNAEISVIYRVPIGTLRKERDA